MYSIKLKNTLLKLREFVSLLPDNNQQFNGKDNRSGATLADFLLRWRWALVAIIGLGVIIFEVYEHARTHPTLAVQLTDRTFVLEVFLYGVVFPLIGGAALSMLNYMKMIGDQVQRHLDHQHELNQRLAYSLEWEMLINTLVKFPHTLAPIVGATLLANDDSGSRFALVAEWWEQQDRPPFITTLYLELRSCDHCANRTFSGHHAFIPSPNLGSKATAKHFNCYCLPLLHNNQLLAVVRIFLPPDNSLTQYQSNLFDSLAPSMALAIWFATSRHKALAKARFFEDERHRIADKLNGSVGQNLTYFQQRLEQLAQNKTLREDKDFQQELKLLREVANEASRQMQRMLTDLRRPDKP